MDLDDSFLEKISQTTNTRREYINTMKTDVLNFGSRKRAALIEDRQIINEDSSEPLNESPKRQCVQPEKKDLLSHENNKENIESISMQVDENIPFVPVHATVKGLAALRRNGPVSRCTSSSEFPPDFQSNESKTYMFSTSCKDICSGPKSKLANLADDIKQWEDDIQKPTESSNNFASAKSDKIPFASLSTPNSMTKSNAFTMKLYYTNATPKNASSSDSENCVHSGININKSDAEGFTIQENSSMPLVYKKGSEDSNTLYKQDRKLKAWDQAISATLGNEGTVSYPKPPGDCNAEYGSDNSDKMDENHIDNEEVRSENRFKSYNVESCNQDNEVKHYEDKICGSGVNKNHNNLCMKSSSYGTPQIPKKNNEQDAEDPNLDPAELPISARKALFEKALLCGTPKHSDSLSDHKLSVAERAAMFENASKVNSFPTGNYKVKRVTPNISSAKSIRSSDLEDSCASPIKVTESPKLTEPRVFPQDKVKGFTNASVPSCVKSPSPSKNIGNHTRFVQQKLLETPSSNCQHQEMLTRTNEGGKREISSLVTHWERLSSLNSQPEKKFIQENVLEDQHKEYFDDSEDQEVFESEDKRCYFETDTGDTNQFLNSPKNDDSEEEKNLFDNQVMDQAEFSDDLEQNYQEDQISDLNETEKPENDGQKKTKPLVLENVKNEFSILSESEKSSTSSSEGCFSISKKTPSCSGSSSGQSHISALLSLTSEGTASTSSTGTTPEVPLTYTVSFYRKQKQEMRTPPVQTIVRRQQVLSPPSDTSDTDQTEAIQERLKALQEEVLRQQTVISQSSQALNLCNATAEFCGSAEQVEGERLLLIATQKRQACLNEMQRLKAHGAQGGTQGISDGTGTLIITDIQLPLKRNFMASQLESASDTVHYFMCLIRHGAQVIMTQMVSTADKVTDGALCFTNHIKLQKLPADFSVVFEVYALQTKKEILPHEKKYHIRREHSKIRLTPKSKKGDGRILLPAVCSPGGPNAVRSPSFVVIGYTRFTLQNCGKKVFALDKVPFTSPLDGVLKVKLQLHAEHKVAAKGFLTMFEDVSGFGAWHRRWCSLDGHHLVYWKYPDDEQKKDPIGIIDLKQCITGQVRLVARDICARPHTFRIVTVRPIEEGDKNTLISRCINTLTTTKHLLSADTKDERILWCNKLNESLTNVRKWDPQALRPTEAMHD